MNTRIRELRKTILKMTQKEFSARLGLSENFIWQIEKGEREPSDRTIADICREFNVSEQWLRTGEGDMSPPRSREEEIADMVSKAISGSNEFKKAVIRMICTRSEGELEALEKMLWEIVADIENNRGQTEA